MGTATCGITGAEFDVLTALIQTGIALLIGIWVGYQTRKQYMEKKVKEDD